MELPLHEQYAQAMQLVCHGGAENGYRYLKMYMVISLYCDGVTTALTAACIDRQYSYIATIGMPCMVAS